MEQSAKLQVPEKGFTPLFNGKDLSGWEGNFKLWKAADGTIKAASPGIKHNDFLATKKEYDHFELRLEFRMKDGKGNSGVQFRSQREKNSTAVIGYQADLGQKYWGCLYDEHRRRRILQNAAQGLEKVLKKNDWNSYSIRAVGNKITLKINGFTTVEYMEEDKTIPEKGLIALQIHSGPAMQMEFRNIRIQLLTQQGTAIPSSTSKAP